MGTCSSMARGTGASAGGGHCVKAAGAVGRARAAGMLMAWRMLQCGERWSIGRARAGPS